MTRLIEEATKVIAEYQEPLVGTSERLADAAWVARAKELGL